MAFGLEKFKQSHLGRRVGAILENPQNIAEMVVFSRHQMPAVQAVGKALLVLGHDVHDDYVKKTIGRWVKEILGRQGWIPWKSRRVSPGKLFSRGMIYKTSTRSTAPRQRGKSSEPLPRGTSAGKQRSEDDTPYLPPPCA